MTLAPGTTVGRYQILEPLGQGGMATVYKAFQPSLQREVALKVLRPGFAQDAEFRERFEREAIAIAKLRHPNIVQVFDFEIAPSGEFVLAMEFLDGGTLKDRTAHLASQGRGMDPKETVRVVWEVADALSYAHDAGIVHRDVKPSNVMLARPRDRAVVTDFGIARILGATSHTQTGVGIGTPEYMAPEQGQGGHVDHRADIYSLGAMAYELLVGRVPYMADTPLAVVIAHIKDPLPLPSKVNPTIGPGVERALLKALAKDPEQRFESAVAFGEALRDGLAADSAGGTMPTIVVRGAVEAGAPAATAAPVAVVAKRSTVSLPPVLAQRPVAFGLASAVVLALVVGSVVSGAFRSTPVSPGSTASISPESAALATAAPPTKTSASLAPLTAVPKGRLLWEAKLDGVTNDIGSKDVGPPGAKETDSEVRQVKGAIEVAIRTSNTGAGIYPNTGARDTYVFEMDGVAAPGTLTILPRQSPTNSGYPRVGVRVGSAVQITYKGSASAAEEALTPPRAAEIQTGSPFSVTIVAEETRYSVFVAGRLVAQAVDDRIKGAYLPRIFYSGPADSTFRITGLRMYEIGSVAVAPAAAATSAPAAPGLASSLAPSTAAPTPAPATAAPVGALTPVATQPQPTAGAFTPAPTVAPTPAPPTAAPTPTPPPPHSIPAKGELIFAARLDGTSADVPASSITNRPGPGTTNTSAGASALRFPVGAVEAAILQPGGGLGFRFASFGASQYIAEWDFSVAPTSQISMNSGFKCASSACYFFRLDTIEQTISVFYSDAALHLDVIPAVFVPGMDRGTVFTVALVVETTRATLFLNEKQVGQGSLSRVTATAGNPGLGIESLGGGTGTLRFLGARYYLLP